jgi:hypothetical protein
MDTVIHNNHVEIDGEQVIIKIKKDELAEHDNESETDSENEHYSGREDDEVSTPHSDQSGDQTTNLLVPKEEHASATVNSAVHTGDKRNGDEPLDDPSRHKKVKQSPASSPSSSSNAATPDSKTTSPLFDMSTVDLIKHVAGLAQMLKEMDSENEERFTKLETEVNKLKAQLLRSSASSLPVSPPLTASSPSLNVSGPKKRGRPPKNGNNNNNNNNNNQQKLTTSSSAVPQQPLPTKHVHVGELIAVRPDPSTTGCNFWIARVIAITKKGFLQVRWFEPFAFIKGWYFLDNKDDEVDVAAVFHTGFELIMKAVEHPSLGHYVDVFRPVEDLSKYDAVFAR